MYWVIALCGSRARAAPTKHSSPARTSNAGLRQMQIVFTLTPYTDHSKEEHAGMQGHGMLPNRWLNNNLFYKQAVHYFRTKVKKSGKSEKIIQRKAGFL
jgi:hypothetical protein